jgi:superfamily I DNA/RNA helicase
VDNLDIGAITTTVKAGQAILSRLNAPLMPLCLRLIRANVPAKIEGRDIGKALLAIVKEVGGNNVEEFLSKLNDWHTSRVNRVINLKNGARRAAEIDDQAETLQAVAEGATTIEHITERLETLFTDTVGGAPNMVLLSSTHKAKGLEWDRVFMLRDTYNSRRTITEAEAKEEQNILYVAITRAKNHLTLVNGR